MAEESVADDLLRNGYERWLRLEAEKDAIGDDLKELFAELKSRGFAPKALRESFRRVRNINDADQQEHDAIVDLYVASLTGARPAPAHARENIEKFDPETGEIHSAAPPADRAAGTGLTQPVPAVNQSQAKASTGNGADKAADVAGEEAPASPALCTGIVEAQPTHALPMPAYAFQAVPNVTPIRQPHTNLDCQKRERGEPCQFADKPYSCAACQALASQKQQSAQRA